MIFNQQPLKTTDSKKAIHVFEIVQANFDSETVTSFGEEWKKFDTFSESEITQIGNDYFDIVPDEIYAGKTVLDMGCGSGRWTKYVARKAAFVEAIDPSDAVYSAAELLSDEHNTRISQASVDNIPFPDNSFDLVFSLGVLHHIPDTEAAMKKCVEKVKNGGYFLVYLYYSLDNRGLVFKTIFNASTIVRKIISKSPTKIKKALCDSIAFFVYYPLAKSSRFLHRIGSKELAKKIPLSYYGDKSFWIMKNDALDRFGTPLEQRFSKKQIEEMMLRSGLTNIRFSNKEPYWHAIGQKQ